MYLSDPLKRNKLLGLNRPIPPPSYSKVSKVLLDSSLLLCYKCCIRSKSHFITNLSLWPVGGKRLAIFYFMLHVNFVTGNVDS